MHLEWHMSKYNFQEIIKHNSHKYKISMWQTIIYTLRKEPVTQYRWFKEEMKNQGYTGMGGKNI